MLCLSKGAKGIESFSQALNRKYLPSHSSIQYEGIFFDYHFSTLNEQERYFRANFNYAVSNDPISHEREYYVSIGLASCMDGDGFYKHGGRPNLNLAIVLDISGSMGGSFSGESQSVLHVAKESILCLLSHLTENDRFSLITFNNSAHIVQKFDLWKNIDQDNLKKKILEAHNEGGTSLTAGMGCASEQLHEVLKQHQNSPSSSSSLYENRIIFLTDMVPTTNDKDGSNLFSITEKNASEAHNPIGQRIYTTFIGLGIDFNTDLVTKIGKIRGCNYFSVKSAKDFKKKMDEEFEYVVTPTVFNVRVEMDPESAQDWQPVRVFGSPGHEVPQQGQLMFMDSCFPSLKESDTMTKGGVVVVKLAKLSHQPQTSIKFVITYEDRLGKHYKDQDTLQINEPQSSSQSEDFFENTSIRKAVLLVRFVSFFKNYLLDMKQAQNNANGSNTPSMSEKSGIGIPPVETEPEHYSPAVSMSELSPAYESLFKTFTQYYEKEMSVIEDTLLDRELQHLLRIVAHSEEQKKKNQN